MLIAALYDIHGNLPALEAVLNDVQVLGVNQIVVGGDVLPGPMPKETLELLQTLDIPIHFIFGNGEVAVLDAIAGKILAKVPEPYRPVIHWNARQLDPDQQRSIAEWPKTVRLHLSGLNEVLFCHATPRDENEIFTSATPEDRLLPLLEGLNADIVVCGHTHMQFDRMIGTVRVVNAGSVGMPFGKPGADWLLLGTEIDLRHTDYDFESAAERIRATSYPQAEEFARNNVLQPPSEAKMLDLFGRAEVRPA